MFFATCSLSGWSRASILSMSSPAADVSSGPVMRNARPKARRRIAARRHGWLGCSHAPRPGRLPAVSTVTANPPFPVDTATTRSSSTASSRLRHPMQVRTGPVSEVVVSRWITAQSTCTTSGVSPRCRVLVAPAAHRRRLGRGLALRGLVVAADVDPPARQSGRQPGVLPFFPDGQRQLEIRDEHARGARIGVDDAHRHDLRG
jgi:hypothetical protein